MVREEEDDRLGGQAVVVELAEDVAGLLVHIRDHVMVTSPVLAYLGGVGVVGGDRRPPGIVPLPGGGVGRTLLVRGLVEADLALVAGGEVEDAEERLALPPVPPVGPVARLVPGRLVVLEVVVGLHVVRAVVSRLPEILGEALDGVGELPLT